MPTAPSHDTIAVVIPIYNEAGNVGSLLGEIDERFDVIVIDDGSSDRGGTIARSHGASVITHQLNLGQGHAVSTGMKAALKRGYQFIVQMDGDGQHDPRYIPDMIRVFEREGGLMLLSGRGSWAKITRPRHGSGDSFFR